MFPTLFTIGRLSIPTYTVLLDLGLILGLLLTYYEGKRRLGDGPLALDLGLWTVVGGIVGGRIGYVVANSAVFSEDWVRVLRIWEGGLSWHGAFLGGLLVMAVFAQFQRRAERSVSFWELVDVVTLGLALGISFGWAACLAGGCAYGALGEGVGYAILPDLYGVEASRFATQAVGLAFSLVLFAGFWLLRGFWPFPGTSLLMYLLLYFAGQFFLEFTRGDEAIYVGPWRLAQWFDLAIALTAALGLLVKWWQWQALGSPASSTGSSLEEEGSDEAGEVEAPAEVPPLEGAAKPGAGLEPLRGEGEEGESTTLS
jgi:phosphatidylglycerol:prolipoprotein diacylglycerol transferase